MHLKIQKGIPKNQKGNLSLTEIGKMGNLSMKKEDNKKNLGIEEE